VKRTKKTTTSAWAKSRAVQEEEAAQAKVPKPPTKKSSHTSNPISFRMWTSRKRRQHFGKCLSDAMSFDEYQQAFF